MRPEGRPARYVIVEDVNEEESRPIQVLREQLQREQEAAREQCKYKGQYVALMVEASTRELRAETRAVEIQAAIVQLGGTL